MKLPNRSMAICLIIKKYVPWSSSRPALDSGKGVAVPKVFGDTMRFIWLTSLQDVAPGYCGIPEPLQTVRRLTIPTLWS